MLKAGAFIYALFIMFIISMLTLLFLTQTRLYSNEISRMQIRDRLEQNTQSGINYSLALDSEQWEDSLQIDLFGKGKDRVQIKKFKWGLMDMVRVKASDQNQHVTKTALVGYKPVDSLKTSLYLTGGASALHLCGQTRIKGNAYLPESGVKRAYIAGESYFGDSLIYGKQLLSESQLPISIDTTGLNKIVRGDIHIVEMQTKLKNSFEDSTLMITDTREIRLEDVVIEGNILISSDSLIEIYPSALLQDVIVRAPVIKVMQGSRFSAQLLASDTLIIENDCLLDYPSLVAVNAYSRGYVSIGAQSTIYGDLWYDNAQTPSNTELSAVLEKESKVCGRLLVNGGNLQLEGEVIGEVFTDGIILKHPVGVYKNHLLSITIDRRALWDDYLFAVKSRVEDKPSVLKWLN